MLESLFRNITSKDKSEAIEGLISRGSPASDFFLMVVLSILMATFGLLSDSAAVIVGSMLIAPVLYPILSLSMGFVMSDNKLVARSLSTLLKSAIFAILTAAVITLLFGQASEGYTAEILLRTKPSLISAAIAAAAGLAASFALVKPQMNETLPGVAISVALVPPLAVVGIGLARLDATMFFSSLLLFMINAFGIIFTSMIVFSVMDFYAKRRDAAEAIKKEEKKEQEKTGAN